MNSLLLPPSKPSSPREVGPATRFDITLPISRLEIFFAPKCIPLSKTCFVVDQFKRSATPRGLDFSVVVQLDSLLQITRASGVKVTVQIGLQNVNVNHCFTSRGKTLCMIEPDARWI